MYHVLTDSVNYLRYISLLAWLVWNSNKEGVIYKHLTYINFYETFDVGFAYWALWKQHCERLGGAF